MYIISAAADLLLLMEMVSVKTVALMSICSGLLRMIPKTQRMMGLNRFVASTSLKQRTVNSSTIVALMMLSTSVSDVGSPLSATVVPSSELLPLMTLVTVHPKTLA